MQNLEIKRMKCLSNLGALNPFVPSAPFLFPLTT